MPGADPALPETPLRQPNRQILASLNPEQQLAVETTEGPVLVLAGAGSGKTRVVTHRIAWLLSRRIPPEALLAVTFTNKAAAEMRQRVAEMVGKQRADRIVLSTFHAYCARTLREHGRRIGLAAGFGIADASDQAAVMRSALRELQVPEKELHPSRAVALVSLAKNLATSAQPGVAPGGDQSGTVEAVRERYQELLWRMRMVDFDDLLLLTLRLLDEHEDLLLELQERHRYLMVDEFQDANPPQFEIVRRLAAAHRNLCVVGDDDQSIYGWRGADVRMILDFPNRMPGATVVRLETNYRSTEQILAAANRVIARNPERHEKTLRAFAGRGEEVAIIRGDDEELEARMVVDDIVRAMRKEEHGLGDIAILFRTQTQPRLFETELRSRRLPYVLVGGMSFFDRKEVRDVLAYLKLAANPQDEVSFLRAIGAPPRGVGKTTLDRALEQATRLGVTAQRALSAPDAAGWAPPAAVAAVKELLSTLAATVAAIERRGLVKAIEDLLERVGYRREVDRSYDDPATREARWGGVLEILDLAENHARRRRGATLASFLEEIALAATEEGKDDGEHGREALTLMTLHSAKGLEFPRVYLVGLEEGIFPHHRSVSEGGIEEERRLAYVGITRARQKLTVSFASQRSFRGRRNQTMPSRFLYEMLDREPPEGWRPTEAPPPPPPTRKKGRRKGHR